MQQYNPGHRQHAKPIGLVRAPELDASLSRLLEGLWFDALKYRCHANIGFVHSSNGRCKVEGTLARRNRANVVAANSSIPS
jgi:hypothetical protein